MWTSPLQVSTKIRNSTMYRFWYDMWLYKTLPRFVPIMTGGIAFASLPIILHQLGWFYGLLLYTMLLMGIFEKLSLYLLPPMESSVACGYAWGTIVSIMWAYFSFVSLPLGSSFWDIYVTVNGALIMYTLLKSTITPPVSLPRGECSCDST